MASLALKHQTELEVKEREMAQLISKHNDELEFLRSAQKQALLTKDDEMSRLMEVNKEQLMGLVSEHKKELLGKNRKMDRLSAGHKIELAELMAKHKTELDEKDRQKVQQAERYDQEICTLVAEQRKELDAKDYKHREELSAKNYEASVLVARHNSQLATMQNQMRELADRHKSECEVKDQEMKAVRNSVDHRILTATKEDRATIKELRRQIAAHYVQNYGYKEIADPEFADKFEILKQKVNQLANKVWEPATFDFHNSLDPTNFLVRNSHQLNWVWPRFVQSTCWSILLAGFFSLPLGFGALGNQGKGHEYMYPTYEAAALYGVNDQEERAFPNDNETNIYRILHFNRILEAIRLDKGSGDVTLARMLEDNIQHVGRQLYDTLGHIVNAQFDQGCATKAMEIARLVAELALDMGTQRSQVVLQMCRHEEKPNPTEWATEQASGASRQQAVDLMVHPCLARIGDGREDSHNKKVIVKGGYVPLAGGYR
ncbi:hypothetical protein QBC43DRAFT_307973 [Cladorrhinum sp. PSN259]|nr:hypothetical protein QBC43DRAFT_307973 [Cladorrhinum sp. PSN259]